LFLTIDAIDASHPCGGKQMVMNRAHSSNQPATQHVLKQYVHIFFRLVGLFYIEMLASL
jgi:hypothetical protein